MSGKTDPGGSYAESQLGRGCGVLSWSHGARFRMARALVAPQAGGRLLDYGCGDGTFLGLVQDLFPTATGTDADPNMLDESRRRLAASTLQFHLPAALDARFDHSFDVITCMEVLEHCTDADAEAVLAHCARLLRPGGSLVVSVPIERGPALLVKYAVRSLLSRRGWRGYSQGEPYSAGELMHAVLRGGTGGPRPLYTVTLPDGRQHSYHGHKGFDWRALEQRIGRHFTLAGRRFSPRLGRWFSAQAWIIARK